MAYSDTLQRSLHIAQAVAHEYRQAHYGAPHLLTALLHNEIGLASWLVAVLDKDIHYLREWAEVRLEDEPKAARPPEQPTPDATVQQALELADLVALQLAREQPDALCALAALLRPGLAFSTEQLKSLPLTQKEILDAAQAERPAPAGVPAAGDAAASPTPARTGGALATYCTDKTAQARAGKLDPIVGRDREIRLVAEILGRRTKPNVLLIGEPGVGKSALVEGFAQQIALGLVPVHLREVTLFELDLGTLVAGASYKGEVEDRIKKVLTELKQYTRAILFIDELHVLLDPKGSAGSGIAQLLKPELARGELTVIGATTNDEYRQYIEKDEAFNRRFDIVRVEEPSVVVAERMLERVLPIYAAHHGIALGEGTVGEAVRLAKRYLKDRQLPDSAIDLVDRTMAAIRMLDEQAVTGLLALQTEFAALTARQGELGADYLRELRWFLYQVQNQVSQLWLNQFENEQQPDKLETSAELETYLRELLTAVLALADTKKESVEKQDIAAIVSGKTGIPLGKLQSNEREKLLRMDQVLQQRVVGQDGAVRALCAAILESRSGLTKAGQPIGSFFLLGPTGTGKTELAKALADFLFNDEAFLIRFDMSEFKEEHSAALLYGAPPGYVGYEEGGLLVNKIREKPYSVVLFDEIEKAHPSVFDIFLQILDEGKLHDRLGREGDFSNAVILFTSNIGAEQVSQTFAAGATPASADLLETMSRHFRPEFLARLTEIVPFAPISEENVGRIFDIHLRPLLEQLRRQGITLTLSAEARQHLALSGFTPKYGARPITGVIRSQLRRPISRLIISGEARPGTTLALTLPEGSAEPLWTTSHAEPEEAAAPTPVTAAAEPLAA
ncbi:MAG: ATP-dependent Clp protease ATP-binding subunit, partial [Janthinobacterium lividum]